LLKTSVFSFMGKWPISPMDNALGVLGVLGDFFRHRWCTGEIASASHMIHRLSDSG